MNPKDKMNKRDWIHRGKTKQIDDKKGLLSIEGFKYLKVIIR